MSKQRRTFSAEDRYSIVQESLRDGHADISRKYNGTGRPAVSISSVAVALPTPGIEVISVKVA